MHTVLVPTSQQLQRQWRALRHDIATDRPAEQVLQMVVDWWNQVPIGNDSLNYLAPANWPDPWLLLDCGNMDRNTTALGMCWTLLLSDDAVWTADRLQLLLLRNRTESWERLVLVVDNQWVLNHDRQGPTHITDIQDIVCMHSYVYDMHKRRFLDTSKGLLAV